jgi:hypothetical protein
MPEARPDPIRIDVGPLVQRSVASLYAHLVTRPTGRAVRLAIESQLAEAGDPAVSLIDLSEVTILDFSCADEVVAKLLQRYLAGDRPREAFFIFRGVQARHREPMVAVLERQDLATVAQREDGLFELLGARTPAEHRAWTELEARGHVDAAGLATLFSEPEDRTALDRVVARRLAFRTAGSGGVHALSRLVRGLPHPKP